MVFNAIDMFKPWRRIHQMKWIHFKVRYSRRRFNFFLRVAFFKYYSIWLIFYLLMYSVKLKLCFCKFTKVKQQQWRMKFYFHKIGCKKHSKHPTCRKVDMIDVRIFQDVLPISTRNLIWKKWHLLTVNFGWYLG